MTSSLVLGLIISVAWTTSLAAGIQQAKNIPGPTIVVAASKSKDKSKAEYVCDGLDVRSESKYRACDCLTDRNPLSV